MKGRFARRRWSVLCFLFNYLERPSAPLRHPPTQMTRSSRDSVNQSGSTTRRQFSLSTFITARLLLTTVGVESSVYTAWTYAKRCDYPVSRNSPTDDNAPIEEITKRFHAFGKSFSKDFLPSANPVHSVQRSKTVLVEARQLRITSSIGFWTTAAIWCPLVRVPSVFYDLIWGGSIASDLTDAIRCFASKYVHGF